MKNQQKSWKIKTKIKRISYLKKYFALLFNAHKDQNKSFFEEIYFLYIKGLKDPDLYKNETDPQYCFQNTNMIRI